MITFRPKYFRRISDPFQSGSRTVILVEAGKITPGPLVDFVAGLKQFKKERGFGVDLAKNRTLDDLPQKGNCRKPPENFPVDTLVAFETKPVSRDAIVMRQETGRLVFPKPADKDARRCIFFVSGIQDLTLLKDSNDVVVDLSGANLAALPISDITLGWFRADVETGLFSGPQITPNGLIPKDLRMFNPGNLDSYIGPLMRSFSRQHIRANFYDSPDSFSLVIEAAPMR